EELGGLFASDLADVNVDLAVGPFSYINNLERTLGTALEILADLRCRHTAREFRDDTGVSPIQHAVRQGLLRAKHSAIVFRSCNHEPSSKINWISTHAFIGQISTLVDIN